MRGQNGSVGTAAATQALGPNFRSIAEELQPAGSLGLDGQPVQLSSDPVSKIRLGAIIGLSQAHQGFNHDTETFIQFQALGL